MQRRITQALGAILLGTWLGCAGDMASGVATISDGAAHDSVEANAHEHVASSGDDHHSKGNHYHGKLVLDSNAPASFAGRPAEGTHFTCPVSGGVFEMESHTRVSVYEGRHYAFCCGGCAQDFDTDPAFFVNRLKEAQAEQLQ